MPYIQLLGCVVLLVVAPAPAQSQQPNSFGAGTPVSPKSGVTTAEPDAPAGSLVAPEADSVVYRLDPSSRLEVKTGKAGLFGFAGHSHVIRARAFTGDVVYYPKTPASSHLQITVQTDSLEVLTPPDTAEIRKVTATMRSEVLHTDRYPEIRLVSKEVTPTGNGFHLVGALTLAGQTHDVPVDLVVKAGADTLRAGGTFSIKQTDFGIKPYSGGPAGSVKVADKVTFTIDAVAVRGATRTAGSAP
jgi:polyisoprenoid-binding protein YceI